MNHDEPELYIVVRNWRKFQYYDQRRPPWIVNHVELLHDDNYLSLPPGTRAILHGLWLEYASSRCRLRLDTASLTRRLAMRVTRLQLDALNHAGFIEYLHAPRMQDAGASRARGRIEEVKERDVEETFAVAREEIAQDDDGEPVENDEPWEIPAELWRMP